MLEALKQVFYEQSQQELELAPPPDATRKTSGASSVSGQSSVLLTLPDIHNQHCKSTVGIQLGLVVPVETKIRVRSSPYDLRMIYDQRHDASKTLK